MREPQRSDHRGRRCCGSAGDNADSLPIAARAPGVAVHRSLIVRDAAPCSLCAAMALLAAPGVRARLGVRRYRAPRAANQKGAQAAQFGVRACRDHEEGQLGHGGARRYRRLRDQARASSDGRARAHAEGHDWRPRLGAFFRLDDRALGLADCANASARPSARSSGPRNAPSSIIIHVVACKR